MDAAAHYRHLVIEGQPLAQIVSNAGIQMHVLSNIMNSFLIDVPVANASFRVHPADTIGNVSNVLELPHEVPADRLSLMTHGYWVGRHMQLGDIPDMRDFGIIQVADALLMIPEFPLPPVEEGMRYTVEIDVPIEDDVLCLTVLQLLRQGLEPRFGQNLAINLTNKRRVPHAPLVPPNNGPPPPAPPNNGPPPHNPGQDPHNENINESVENEDVVEDATLPFGAGGAGVDLGQGLRDYGHQASIREVSAMAKSSLPGSKKRGSSGDLEAQKEKKRKIDRSVKVRCLTILKTLMSKKESWPFNEPVDPVKLRIPDYFRIISHPMDLGTVKSKLQKELYFSAEEFAADVRLTFSNAMLYNPPGNPFHHLAENLNSFFEMRWGLLDEKLSHGSSKFKSGNPSSTTPVLVAASGEAEHSETNERGFWISMKRLDSYFMRMR